MCIFIILPNNPYHPIKIPVVMVTIVIIDRESFIRIVFGGIKYMLGLVLRFGNRRMRYYNGNQCRNRTTDKKNLPPTPEKINDAYKGYWFYLGLVY